MRHLSAALVFISVSACSRAEEPSSKSRLEGPAVKQSAAPLPSANVAPPPSDIAGFRLGESPESFRGKCKAAGLAVDVIDPREPAWVFEDVKANRSAQCRGTPSPHEYGLAVQANAAFIDGRLASMTLYVDESPDVLRNRISARYPSALHGVTMGRDIWVVNRSAGHDDLMSMGLGPAYPTVGGRATVTYSSKDGVDREPQH